MGYALEVLDARPNNKRTLGFVVHGLRWQEKLLKQAGHSREAVDSRVMAIQVLKSAGKEANPDVFDPTPLLIGAEAEKEFEARVLRQMAGEGQTPQAAAWRKRYEACYLAKLEWRASLGDITKALAPGGYAIVANPHSPPATCTP